MEWVRKKNEMRCPPIRVRRVAQKPQLLWLLQRVPIAFVITLTLCFLPFLVHALVATKAPKTGTPDKEPARLARLSETISVHAAGRGNPTINLSDGHDLLTSYVGPKELRSVLEQNQAEPLSLASADFDEDGVPDLISGYTHNGRGIITLLRGNVDSIYPNAPEAQQRRATARAHRCATGGRTAAPHRHSRWPAHTHSPRSTAACAGR